MGDVSIPDLITFLNARLDEDEHWAHMAEAGWPPENALAASEDPEHYPFMATDITPSKATFIRRQDPARALREVQAKRQLITIALENASETDSERGDGHTADELAAGKCSDYGNEAALRNLAPLASIWEEP